MNSRIRELIPTNCTKNEKRRLPRQIYKAQKKRSNNSRIPPRSTKRKKQNRPQPPKRLQKGNIDLPTQHDKNEVICQTFKRSFKKQGIKHYHQIAQNTTKQKKPKDKPNNNKFIDLTSSIRTYLIFIFKVSYYC